MDLSNYNLVPVLEAILFASPEAVTIEKLCVFSESKKSEVLDALDLLREKYDAADSGLTLQRKADTVTISTKESLGEIVSNFMQSRKSPYLSNAALEVLAITAYNQPVTKTYISQIRGVPSGELVENLVEKKLMRERGKLDLPGRPMSYSVTEKFLTIFNIDKVEDIPYPEGLKRRGDPDERQQTIEDAAEQASEETT